MNTKSVLGISAAALACLSVAWAATTAPQTKTGSIDGSTDVECGTTTLLFGGATPPNGFWLQFLRQGAAVANDNGPATYDPISGVGAGFPLGPGFTTPPGYKPMGPVSVYAYNCGASGSVYFAARAW
jgi:hypothetical protein